MLRRTALIVTLNGHGVNAEAAHHSFAGGARAGRQFGPPLSDSAVPRLMRMLRGVYTRGC